MGGRRFETRDWTNRVFRITPKNEDVVVVSTNLQQCVQAFLLLLEI